jgi:hypothetical protein
MNLLTIFVFVLILVLAYAVYKLMTKTTATVSGFSDGTRMVTVPAKNFGISQNYGYSVWVYIDAWQNTQTDGKILGKNILTRCSTTTPPTTPPPSSTTSPTTSTLFNLYLDNEQNNLNLLMAGNKCTIQNVKLQKWFNITMSIYGNTVDLYLDGKLVRTCILQNTPTALNTNDILYVGGMIDTNAKTCTVNDGGDLAGYISNVVFKTNYFTPEEAWSIYGDGYSGAGMFGFLHSYKLNFSITNNNQTVGQISI